MRIAAVLVGAGLLAACSSDPATRERQAEALRAMGGSMQSAGAAMRQDNPEAAAPVAAPTQVCFKTSEAASTMTRICYYNCTGTAYATTVGIAELCPLSVQR